MALFMLKKLDKSLNKEDKGGRCLKSYQQLRLGGYTHSPINPNVCVQLTTRRYDKLGNSGSFQHRQKQIPYRPKLSVGYPNIYRGLGLGLSQEIRLLIRSDCSI